MRVWKIRHKKTGLFYQTVKGRWSGTKSNLSERGRIYELFPKLNDINNIRISNSLLKKYKMEWELSSWSGEQKYLIFKEDDFEIVEYELKEIKDGKKRE